MHQALFNGTSTSFGSTCHHLEKELHAQRKEQIEKERERERDKKTNKQSN